MLNGQFTTAQDARDYITAGHGRITLRSEATGARFTYRFGTPPAVDERTGRKPIFVSLLNGSDNDSAYAFIGTLWRDREGRLFYRHGRKSRTTQDAPSVKAIAWTVAHIAKGALPGQLGIWHEGVCGRCGRSLTVPESVERGIGPDCAKKM